MLDNPEISDYEYDQMLKDVKNLKKLIQSFMIQIRQHKRVEAHINNDFISVQHNYPMYSLENSYTHDELINERPSC